MALALSWTGYADTDLSFAEFATDDHSILLRFMAQYPDAYEGPFVAENGSGTFAFGMGDYMAATDLTTKLMLMAGTAAMNYQTNILPATWYHAAVTVQVTATTRTYRVYVNGAQVGAQMSVPSSAASPPQGTVRIGKRTTGQTLNGRNGQFYGLIDDVAVYTRLLDAREIASIASRQPQLSGTESGLLAGFTFQAGRVAAKLSRKVSLHGVAKIVASSANRDSAADAKLLPLPTAQQPMDLPFPAGEAWRVSQGVNVQGGSHRGYACFCWDFVLADKAVEGVYPNGTDRAPFFASAPGKVLTAREVAASGDGQYSNYVEIEQAPKEVCAYLHLVQNSADVAKDDLAAMGQKLALTGDTGTGVDKFHLHLAVADGKDKSDGFVTFPVAFHDYEVRKSGGGWTSVARGMPTDEQVVRNPPTPLFGARGLGVWGAVSRGANQLDVVATDVLGRAWRAHWTPGRYAGNWDRWRPVRNDIASPQTPVGLVSLDAHRLDVFLAGADGKTYTAAWDDRIDNAVWRGWWNILTGHIPPGGAVTAVSRAPDKLDVFLVSKDGGVYTAAWDHNAASGKWRGWWRIGGLVAKPGSPVAAVARAPTRLDIFVAGIDGRTYTAAWDANVANGEWRGWWNVQTGHIPPGGTITAVARDANKLDIFLVSKDGGVYTAAWDHNAASGKWRGWWRIGAVIAKAGSPVGVVARAPDKLDIFVAGIDGKTYTAAWDANAANGTWQGWWNILTGHINPGSAVAAVARAPTRIDIFIVSKDLRIYTAAWDRDVNGGKWQGWWRIGA